MIKIKLAEFDMDGTLFDTETANFMAYREACVGYAELDEDLFRRECFSRNYREFLPILGISDVNIMEDIHQKKTAVYPDYFDNIHVNYKLFEIATLLKQNGTAPALITTASRENTVALLAHFGYEDFFDLLVTRETVERLKPYPDAFIFAMNYFNADGKETIIFEDSEVGLNAASQTGAAVYKIVNF